MGISTSDASVSSNQPSDETVLAAGDNRMWHDLLQKDYYGGAESQAIVDRMRAMYVKGECFATEGGGGGIKGAVVPLPNLTVGE